ncbi:MAG: sugar phosphate nucleotidyltransferase [Chloroflexota bacterium]
MTEQKMKALILAAGPTPKHQTESANSPWILQMLGDRPIIDYVIELALQVVPPTEVIIVVDKRQNPVETHLGDRFTYIEQAKALGTGHAVLQTYPLLKDYPGSLLILYGDSPFFRRSSIMGLIQRHCLKEASLTLMTGITIKKLRSGRVLRAQNGHIVDIIENADVSPAMQSITEMNTGACVVKADVLWPALQELATAQQGHSAQDIRFTACVRHLIHSGCSIDNYRVLDEDELHDINTIDDLQTAALILQKRQLRPRRIEEHNIIHFGTGGWRALIGEGFTLDNVRRLCQSLANEIVRQGREADGVLIGYDRRFLGDASAEAAAEVFAGNGVQVKLLTEPIPTPLVTYVTALNRHAYGLIFTASHNPPQWNGLKVFATDGSLPLDDETRSIEEEANQIKATQVVKIDLETALQSEVVRCVDYTNAYVDAVEALIDLDAIRTAQLRVVIDPMYGVGQNALEIILTEARCRMDTINTRHDPLFGGRSPAPDSAALALLTTTVLEGGYDLGLAMDGDADRIAIIDEAGSYISTNELLILLYYYLYKIRKERGGVTRNLATTHLLDRLAAHFGEEAYEVPVGFKHLAASMIEHDVLLAGESSGGLSIRGHILGKDGIFACALVVEMMAKTGRSIRIMLDEIYTLIGRLVSKEINLPATPDMKLLVPTRLAEVELSEICKLKVNNISHSDGTKFYLENDSWLLMRFSGTEPLLRLFAEAETEEEVDNLLAWGQSFIQM